MLIGGYQKQRREELGLNANIYEVSVGSDGKCSEIRAVVTQHSDLTILKTTIWSAGWIWNGKCYELDSTFKMLK